MPWPWLCTATITSQVYAYDARNRLIEARDNGTSIARYTYNAIGHRVYEDDLVPDTRRELIYNPGWQIVEERLYEDDTGTFDRLLLVAQNIWGQRYIDDLIARRVQRGTSGGSYTPPDGSWGHGHLSLILTDSMFSVRQIIGDDWADTSYSLWQRERASLEVDYTAYGLPDAVVGLATDPWTDFDGDGDVDATDASTFLTHYGNQDARADRNADSAWTFADVQFFSADVSAAGQTLTPTGRLNEEENPFGLDGYRYDAITGLYHVRHRVLDPEQGKWMQRDPAGFVDGGSVYAYLQSSPLSGVDPRGTVRLRFRNCTASQEADLHKAAGQVSRSVFTIANVLIPRYITGPSTSGVNWANIRATAPLAFPATQSAPGTFAERAEWRRYLFELRSVFDAMESDLDSPGMKFDCCPSAESCAGGVDAWTTRLRGWIHLCPSFWKLSGVRQQQEVLHEYSHVSATTIDSAGAWGVPINAANLSAAPHDAYFIELFVGDPRTTFDTQLLFVGGLINLKHPRP